MRYFTSINRFNVIVKRNCYILTVSFTIKTKVPCLTRQNKREGTYQQHIQQQPEYFKKKFWIKQQKCNFILKIQNMGQLVGFQFPGLPVCVSVYETGHNGILTECRCSRQACVTFHQIKRVCYTNNDSFLDNKRQGVYKISSLIIKHLKHSSLLIGL